MKSESRDLNTIICDNEEKASSKAPPPRRRSSDFADYYKTRPSKCLAKMLEEDSVKQNFYKTRSSKYLIAVLKDISRVSADTVKKKLVREVCSKDTNEAGSDEEEQSTFVPLLRREVPGGRQAEPVGSDFNGAAKQKSNFDVGNVAGVDGGPEIAAFSDGPTFADTTKNIDTELGLSAAPDAIFPDDDTLVSLMQHIEVPTPKLSRHVSWNSKGHNKNQKGPFVKESLSLSISVPPLIRGVSWETKLHKGPQASGSNPPNFLDLEEPDPFEIEEDLACSLMSKPALLSEINCNKTYCNDQQETGSNSPNLFELGKLDPFELEEVDQFELAEDISLVETPSVMMQKRKSLASTLCEIGRDSHKRKSILSMNNTEVVISSSRRASRRTSLQSIVSAMTVNSGASTNEILYSYMANNKAYRWCQKNFSVADKFHFWCIICPLLFVLWYATAVLLPSSWEKAWPYLVWTSSLVGRDEVGRITVGCPPYGGRRSICSEGWFQVVLIALARLSAYATYVVMGMTFMSKMHSTVHFFSTTYLATMIPFEALHDLHTSMGSIYSGLVLLHTVTHFIRWGVRYELIWGITSKWGVSGIIGFLAIVFCVLSMSSLAKKIKFTFENRFLAHWISVFLLTAAICFHHWRTRIIALTFFLLWFLDYSWGILFRTHRLEVVEFVPLPDGAGTQVLWRNPKGFQPKSGEYVKIQVPWLSSERGKEWHPFSLYLKEETKEGLDQINQKETGDIIVGDMTNGGKPIVPCKTALILIGWQNGFVSPNGKCYHKVKEVMDYTDCLPKTVSLVKFCRDAGVHIIHVHISSSMDHSTKRRGSILKNFQNDDFFVENSWNSEAVLDPKPQAGDSIINISKASCSFTGTNLEALLTNKGIETIALSGFRTNSSIESTMRTAYEKELNVITLIDSMACNSKKEQLAAINNSFKLLSTPLRCNQFKEIILGRIPQRLLKTKSVSTLNLDEANELQSVQDIDEGLEEFVEILLYLDSPFEESQNVSTLARQDLTKLHNTTQIFVVPAGDWSKALAKEVDGRNQMRSCWVKGPFTSPYHIASDFSHIVLMASGIGITPALGVIGQYPGLSRTKILVWTLRSKNMVKFFAPLLKDVHIAVIFYTGKEKLSSTELKRIQSLGNIYVQQARPKSLTETIASLIVMFERGFNFSIGHLLENNDQIKCLDDIHQELRATWVTLYCGGSTRIRDELALFAKKSGIGWECELFDW